MLMMMMNSIPIHNPKLFSPKSQTLNTFPSTKRLPIKASQDTQQPSSKHPLAAVLDVPRNLWRQTLRPLSDFGFGRRSIWEGGVGLFLVSGSVLLALTLFWLRAFHFKSRFRKYVALFDFAHACGIQTGTQVRIRGVTVGNVIRVNPSLKSIEAVVEVTLFFFFFFF